MARLMFIQESNVHNYVNNTNVRNKFINENRAYDGTFML